MSGNSSATITRRTPLQAATAPSWQVWTALLTVYVVWGSTYLGIAFVIETLPPLTAMGTRFTVAGAIVLIAVGALRGRSALSATRAELGTAAASGVLLLVGGNGLVAVAQQGVSSGLAALLVASVPLWVVLLRALFGDRPALPTIAGVLVGMVGTAVLLLPGGGGRTDPAYAGLVVVAAMSWSCGAYLATRRPVPKDPFLLTSVQMLAGGTAMLGIGALAGDWTGLDVGEVSQASWIALSYLIVFGSILAFTAFAWLLQNAPVSQVTTYAYVNPVVAVALGALLRDEEVTGTVLLGGGIIVAAVAVVVSVEGRRRSRVPSP